MKQPHNARDLLEMIVSGGLLEDFLEYLRSRNVNVDDIKNLYELDPDIVRDYAVSKNLLESGDRVEELRSGGDVEERYEPLEMRPRTQPR